MTMEKFNQNDRVLGKYDRPEDELETPEIVEVNKRERAFGAEGGFRNLLRLKIVIDDLEREGGFLYGSSVPDFIKQVIDDPKKYAHSAFGIDMSVVDISEDVLKASLDKFLEESKIPAAADIDKYLTMIVNYESTTQSEALKELKYTLEECKKSALSGDWESYCKQAVEAKSFLQGMENVVELCCGTAVETDSTRSVLGADKKKT